MDTIPTIDLSKLREDEPESWEEVAKEVKEACHGIGFMYLLNHGIPQEKIDAAFKHSVDFFSLPQERKLEFLLSRENQFKGYSGPGMEVLTRSGPSAVEFRESFAIVGVDCSQPFPEETPDFKKALYELEPELNSLTRRLLVVLGQALELPDPHHFVKSNLGLTDTSIPNRITLRSQWYPRIPEEIEIPENSIRCGAHTDIGICTLLFQDGVGGLEVKNSEGNWIKATPIPGTVVVNLGDVMEMWTDGYFKATAHRVQIPEAEIRARCPRQSIAYFVHTDDDYVITPLTSTPNYDFGSEFKPIRFAEFLDKRIGDTYK